MNHINLLFAGILSTYLLASCSSYELRPESFGPIQFNSTISSTQSRVTGNTWDNNDEIGIFMQTSTAIDSNHKYTAQPNGTLTAAPNHELLHPLKGTANFLAYYPYSASLSGTDIALSVTDQSTPSAIDFLYSNNAKDIEAGQTVNLQFTHQLSQFLINIQTDETITDTRSLTVSLSGMNTTAQFNLTNAVLSPTDSKADIDMNVNAEGTLARAIILPSATTNGMSIHFTLNGITSSWPIAIPETNSIESGCRYTFTANLSIKEEQQVVTMDNATISAWTEKSGGDFNIEFDESNTNSEINPEPEVDPNLTPTILYEENCGKTKAKDTSINKYSNWSDRHYKAVTDPTISSGSSNAIVKHTESLDNHIWFPSNKNSGMHIAPFDGSTYKSIRLTYDITSYFASKAPNQNTITVSTNQGKVEVPSLPIASSDTYQTVTLTLPTTLTYLQFNSSAETNTSGFRIDNIKVVGLK